MDTSRFFGGITSLARPIDPSYASNRLALAASVAFTLVGTVLTLVRTEADLLTSASAGVGYGIGAFLAWATARELDPDHPVSARDAVLAYAVVAFTGRPALLATTAVMVAVRVVARTTGRGPTPVDLVALVALAGLAGRSAVGFITGAALAGTLWLDTRLPATTDDDEPAATPQVAAAAFAFTAAFVVTLASGAFLSGWRGPTPLEGVIAVVVGAALPRLRARHVTSTADLTRRPLDPVRVRRGQQLTVAAAVVGILWAGFAAVGELGPVLAAIVGVGLTGWRRRTG